MKIAAKILKMIGCVLLALVLLVAVALGIFTAAEYRPAETETLISDHETDPVLEAGKLLTVVSWNCGYGALGDNADFFMDGGTSVYTADRERVESNLEGIRDEAFVTEMNQKVQSLENAALAGEQNVLLLSEIASGVVWKSHTEKEI